MAIIDGKNELELTSDISTKAEVIAFEEPKDKDAVAKENLELSGLVAFIKNKYTRSRDQRKYDETRWLMAYNNYRGLYGPDVQFTDTEKSKAFIKITKTKVLAANAQINEILFAGNKFPIGVESSPVPLGIAESVHFDPKSPDEMAKQQGGAGPKPSSTVARQDILTQIGPLTKQLEPIKDQLKEGPGLTPTSYTFEPAKIAARNMDLLIQDQLQEAQAGWSLQKAVFDACLFGTGIMKGPFAVDKEYPKWDEEGKYIPLRKTLAEVSYVSIWDAYPDPDAYSMKDSEHFIQRHKLSKTQMRDLKKRPHFRKESIEKAIANGTNYVEEYWENTLRDNLVTNDIDRYEVFEYWGIVDTDIAKEADLKIPEDFKDRDQVQVNVWICGGEILRLVLNPFTPNRIPYHVFPYELNPYSFFGVGVAENMEDSQLLMNGFFRMAVDNAALSSNIMLDVDETFLVPGQDFSFHPGKIFRRQGGQANVAINPIKFPNVTQECMALFDKARQLADESTGMPSYSHGISGVMGTGRTAAGMSMLMGAAKENIKAVVRNIDNYLLSPMGKDLFAFNMQFNFDKKYIGDVEVVARGTESLMRNEVRSQKLLQFLQVASNPMDAPFVKRDYILRELAQSLDLEPDKVVNDPREAAIQAKLMSDMQKIMGIAPEQMGAPQGNPASVPSSEDPTGTGGGNIAPGAAPTPGEQGNTGAGGGSPQAAATQQPAM